jgi:hypothetical protein
MKSMALSVDLMGVFTMKTARMILLFGALLFSGVACTVRAPSSDVSSASHSNQSQDIPIPTRIVHQQTSQTKFWSRERWPKKRILKYSGILAGSALLVLLLRAGHGSRSDLATACFYKHDRSYSPPNWNCHFDQSNTDWQRCCPSA